jgi:LDH2 family malate/lactate/ureidoglycolate dehydrogenase
MIYLKSGPLKELTACVLETLGASGETSNLVAELLIEANLRGVDSHGIMRIPEYIKYVNLGELIPPNGPRLVRDTITTAIIDGQKGFGQLSGMMAMKIALKKAKTSGVGIVSCYNTTHIGRLADYARLAVENKMIGLLFVKTPAQVSPFGGYGRILGTNPVSFGIPAGKEASIIADFSTSAASEGKIRIKKIRKEELPVGWLLSKQGNSTLNPIDFYEGGSLLPFGEFKGYALSLIVEALGGALSGQGVADEFTSTNGVCAVAINIDSFIAFRKFTKSIDELIEKIRNCSPVNRDQAIMLPGEREEIEKKKRLKSGIPLDDSIWTDIERCANKYNVTLEQCIRN